jgi:hypothetical protein
LELTSHSFYTSGKYYTWDEEKIWDTTKRLINKLPQISQNFYYSNPLIYLHPRMHKPCNVVELKDCLLLHSEHAPTLFSHIWNRVHALQHILFGLKLPISNSWVVSLQQTQNLQHSTLTDIKHKASDTCYHLYHI